MKFRNVIFLLSLFLFCFTVINASAVVKQSDDDKEYTLDNSIAEKLLAYEDKIFTELKINSDNEGDNEIELKNVKVKDQSNAEEVILEIIKDSNIMIDGYEIPVKKGSNIKINNKGEIIDAYLLIGKGEKEYTKLLLFDNLLELPEGAEVSISKYVRDPFPGEEGDKRSILIHHPPKKIVEPKSQNKNGDEVVIEYRALYDQDREIPLVLPNGKAFNMHPNMHSSDLYFRKGEFVIFGEEISIGNYQNSEFVPEFNVYNPSDLGNSLTLPNYFFITDDISEIDPTKNYLVYNDDNLRLYSPFESGIIAEVTETNKFGFYVTKSKRYGEPSNTAKVKAINGFVSIENQGLDNSPLVKINGNSIIGLDSSGFYADNNKMRYSPDTSMIERGEDGTNFVPTKIILVDDKGNRISNFDLYTNDEHNAKAFPSSTAPDDDLFKSTKGSYFSGRVSLNILTKSASDYFLSLDNQKKQGFLVLKDAESEVKNEIDGDRDNKINYQTRISQVLASNIQEENSKSAVIKVVHKSLTPDKYYAGGSATVIDDKGHILSAGHVFDYKPNGEKYKKGDIVSFQLQNGEYVRAELIAVEYEKTPGGHIINDLALLKLMGNKRLTYISVSTDEFNYNTQLANALRVGFPGGKFSSNQEKNVQVRSEIYSDYPVIKGDSGGPLIYKGKLIGVTHGRVLTRNNRYSVSIGLDKIRKFLQENNVGI